MLGVREVQAEKSMFYFFMNRLENQENQISKFLLAVFYRQQNDYIDFWLMMVVEQMVEKIVSIKYHTMLFLHFTF